MTNALMPALVAVVRRYQKLMSMYDAAPTSAAVGASSKSGCMRAMR